MFTQLTALKPTGSAACPTLLFWATCNKQLLRTGNRTAPLILHVQAYLDSIKCFFVQIISTLQAPPKKRKITWNSQTFTALTIKEENIIGQRIAKSLQNRSIAVLAVSGGKYTACLSPPPPKNRKKEYGKNAKRHRTASQSQATAQATGNSSLYLLKIISYTIWKTTYQDKACRQNKLV